MAALQEAYKKEIKAKLLETGTYRNPMEVPRLTKVVINMSMGAGEERDALTAAATDLARITGQQPVITYARKSISNFRLREGMPLGCKVTLRGARMFEFLERLINVTLPRIRDFRGIPANSFDGRGNYSLGLQEQTLFPEIDPDKVKRTQGMDITVVSTAKTDDEARELLRLMGMPFATS